MNKESFEERKEKKKCKLFAKTKKSLSIMSLWNVGQKYLVSMDLAEIFITVHFKII